jgi:hypothetical protein
VADLREVFCASKPVPIGLITGGIDKT